MRPAIAAEEAMSSHWWYRRISVFERSDDREMYTDTGRLSRIYTADDPLYEIAGLFDEEMVRNQDDGVYFPGSGRLGRKDPVCVPQYPIAILQPKHFCIAVATILSIRLLEGQGFPTSSAPDEACGHLCRLPVRFSVLILLSILSDILSFGGWVLASAVIASYVVTISWRRFLHRPAS